jgi:hypothetical protein
MLTFSNVKSHFTDKRCASAFNPSEKMDFALYHLLGENSVSFQDLNEEEKREATAYFAEAIVGFTEADGTIVLYGPVSLCGPTFRTSNPNVFFGRDLSLRPRALTLTTGHPRMVLSRSFYSFISHFMQGENPRVKNIVLNGILDNDLRVLLKLPCAN